jgi:hypothetical protein
MLELGVRQRSGSPSCRIRVTLAVEKKKMAEELEESLELGTEQDVNLDGNAVTANDDKIHEEGAAEGRLCYYKR